MLLRALWNNCTHSWERNLGNMPDKTKQLEQLVAQVLSRQEDLQARNKTLEARVRVLEETADKLKQAETEIKDLRTWKKNAQNALRRLAVKIDKELEKQKQAQEKIG